MVVLGVMYDTRILTLLVLIRCMGARPLPARQQPQARTQTHHSLQF